MLLTTITCFRDQMVAEEMRAIAARLEADYGIIELAADEAVAAYQDHGDRNAEIAAGIAFVPAMQDGPAPDEPFRWFESWLVEHVMPAARLDAFEVELTRDGAGVRAFVSDAGSAFDPREAYHTAVADTLAQLTPGGLGLVRRLSDAFEYGRVAGRNRVRLCFLPRELTINPACRDAPRAG